MDFDLIIRGGTVYDGTGNEGRIADVAIAGRTIAAIEQPVAGRAQSEIEAEGLAVAPGFINMLSWANESLIEDGCCQSDIRQGVTLEVFGEGISMGPLNSAMKEERIRKQGDIKYDIAWTTLAQYLDYLVRQGVSANVASFVGATTVRMHVLGERDRDPLPEELEAMCKLVRQAMRQGALGVGSALIYAPGFYASSGELIALAGAASEYGGMYISHLRSEGASFLVALEELFEIARAARARSEIYHLKAAGMSNWAKFPRAVAMIESARQSGLPVTANMYAYTHAATGLDAAMPPWVQEGGHNQWVRNLENASLRAQVEKEMTTPTALWENGFLNAGPENMYLVGFKSQALKELTGKTLLQVAQMRGKSPEATAIDLVIEDDSCVETVYGWMSEENVRLGLKQSWVSLGSDGASLSPAGTFLKSSTHPRAYGNFARFLGKYVRDEKLMSLSEAIRRLTSLPAGNLGIEKRGLLKKGYFADIVVFDPSTINDLATFAEPHQYSVGVQHVFVNGTAVIAYGNHTGAKPGCVVRGPGWGRP